MGGKVPSTNQCGHMLIQGERGSCVNSHVGLTDAENMHTYAPCCRSIAATTACAVGRIRQESQVLQWQK